MLGAHCTANAGFQFFLSFFVFFAIFYVFCFERHYLVSYSCSRSKNTKELGIITHYFIWIRRFSLFFSFFFVFFAIFLFFVLSVISKFNIRVQEAKIRRNWVLLPIISNGYADFFFFLLASPTAIFKFH